MFFIKKLFYLIKFICVMIICFQCGYQYPVNIIENKDNIHPKTQTTVLLYSFDPFNALTRIIRQELYWNNINVINDFSNSLSYQYLDQNIFSLKILNILKNRVVVSVFQDGTESEYQIILKIKAQYCKLINKPNCYPINIRIKRTFMREPNGILSNLVQENEILAIMYADVAQQLMQHLLIQSQHAHTDF